MEVLAQAVGNHTCCTSLHIETLAIYNHWLRHNDYFFSLLPLICSLKMSCRHDTIQTNQIHLSLILLGSTL